MDSSPTDTPGVLSEAAVRGILAGVRDPELGASIVDLGMLRDVEVSPGGDVKVQVALTTAGCPLRGQIKADVISKVHGLAGRARGDGRLCGDDPGRTVRGDAAGPARGGQACSRHRDIRDDPRHRGRERQGRRGQVVGDREHRHRARGAGSRRRCARRRHLGVQHPAHARCVRASRRGRSDDLTKGKIEPAEIVVPNTDPSGPAGRIAVVSMGLLVDDEDTALMWRGLILSKALEQFLTDVKWGELDYLLLDMPPGTGDIQMALSRLLPQTEMLVVTTPAKNAQKVAARVADMARRSYLKVLGVVENMSEFVAPDGSRHAIFGSGGGKRLAALDGRAAHRSDPDRAGRVDRRRRRQARRARGPRRTRGHRVHAYRTPHRRRAAATGRDGRLHRTNPRARDPRRGAAAGSVFAESLVALHGGFPAETARSRRRGQRRPRPRRRRDGPTPSSSPIAADRTPRTRPGSDAVPGTPTRSARGTTIG